MSLLELYEFLKERKKLIKSNIEMMQTRASLYNYHIKLIKKHHFSLALGKRVLQ